MITSVRPKGAIITALITLLTIPTFASESCAVIFVNPVLSRVESTLNLFAPGTKFAQGNYMIRGVASMMDESTGELVFVDVNFALSVKDNTLNLDRQIFIRTANEVPKVIAEFMMGGTVPRLMSLHQPGESVVTIPGDTGSPYSVVNRTRFFVRNFSTMSTSDSEAVSDAISAFIIAHMDSPVRSQRN